MATAEERAANLTSIKSTLMPTTPDRIPIIDSHVHLYPSSEIPSIAWLTDSAPAELQGQHSLSDYRSDTQAPSELEGFIFLETDRKFDNEAAENDEWKGKGWEGPLMEVEWLRRIAMGTPKDGEGHTAEDAKLCLGIVPWAPVASGVEAMEAYVQLAEQAAGGSWSKVRGFRYLVQDKPDGTMLEEKFIESLRWLGRKGFVFDHGVDHHRGGDVQLRDTIEMIARVHEGVPSAEKTVFILNHLCKPDLTITNYSGCIDKLQLIEDYECPTEPESFQAWEESIFALSKFPRTYLKLSGLFSELPEALQKESEKNIFEVLTPWLIVIFTAFRGRMIFGSDWPVCTVGVGGRAWSKWKWIVEQFCDVSSMSVAEQVMLWSGTAIEAYGMKELV